MDEARLTSKVLIALFAFFNILMFSCNNEERKMESALKQAGVNREELMKVTELYKKNREDSLKLQAACFLIENMPSYSWQSGLSQFDVAFDSIAGIDNLNLRKRIFVKLLDSLAKIPTDDRLKVVKDIETLSTDYLVENIDLAFDAWYRHPVEKRSNFETFCNFILPYRNYNEPVESGTRRWFLEKYSWVFDSLNNHVPLKRIADQIINPFKFTVSNFRSQFPIPLSSTQFESCKMGLCMDEVNYFVNLFRALGIASSEEIIPHYGNSYSTGHSFLRLKYGDEIYCEGNLLAIYKDESIPKVYRRVFSKNYEESNEYCHYLDVTQEYKTTIDMEISTIFNKPGKNVRPEIYVFSSQTQWKKVANGYWKKKKNFYFKNIGTNVLYLAAYYSHGQLYAVNYPFSVLKDKTVHFWKPSTEINDSIILLRKAGVKQPRSLSRTRWVDSLNNGLFQGANDPSFKYAKTLAKIKKLNSTQAQIIVVKNNQAFRYVRFYANKRHSYLAKLEFLDPKKEKIAGLVLKPISVNSKWEDGAFDDDPLTYSGGSDFFLGLKMEKPQQIGYIRFQPRNDDNHIRINDTYELFYWNKEWKSLGTQVAVDTLLVYSGVARNSLLWLRNLSRGKEENTFVMEENGRQNWLGFCN